MEIANHHVRIIGHWLLATDDKVNFSLTCTSQDDNDDDDDAVCTLGLAIDDNGVSGKDNAYLLLGVRDSVECRTTYYCWFAPRIIQ